MIEAILQANLLSMTMKDRLSKLGEVLGSCQQQHSLLLLLLLLPPHCSTRVHLMHKQVILAGCVQVPARFGRLGSRTPTSLFNPKWWTS